jgi:hypothetical protein
MRGERRGEEERRRRGEEEKRRSGAAEKRRSFACQPFLLRVLRASACQPVVSPFSAPPRAPAPKRGSLRATLLSCDIGERFVDLDHTWSKSPPTKT